MLALARSTLHLGKCWQRLSGISLRNMASALIPTLTMYTKEECSLCHDAKDILAPYLNKINFEEVDITEPGNEEIFYKYRFDIPVFHLNGKYLMKHRVDKDRLEAALLELNESSSET